jgi:phosphoribosylformylglycinamidine synthase
MGDACRALDFPIVSGNVSLYNESKATGGGSAILPTPAIGGIGLLKDWRKSATIAFKAEGEQIMLIGTSGGHLGQSLWLREIVGQEHGPPPPVDLAGERRSGELVRSLVAEGAVTAVHDLADGGLLVALAEMALAGGIGVELDPDLALRPGFAFGEDQGRYLVTVGSDEQADAIRARASHSLLVGRTGGNEIAGVGLDQLRRAHEAFFPRLMGRELAVA